MAVESQQYEDDPIIAALGITQEARPAVPPVDVVYGHYQQTPPTFRLYLETFSMYMEGPLGRLLFKGKGSGDLSKLYLRADGDYEDDITIEFTGLGSTVGALDARYFYAKTTPWHET